MRRTHTAWQRDAERHNTFIARYAAAKAIIKTNMNIKIQEFGYSHTKNMQTHFYNRKTINYLLQYKVLLILTESLIPE